ncbi:MAG: hypothetical protein ACHQ50_02135 [Fimbriimonadales bacterium]
MGRVAISLAVQAIEGDEVGSKVVAKGMRLTWSNSAGGGGFNTTLDQWEAAG